jgi:glucose/arabinose dehydrogenase
MRGAVALAAAVVALAPAAPAGAAVHLERVGARFAQPVYVTSPPGRAGDVVVVQRFGLIRVVRGGRVLRRPLADLRRRVVRAGGDITADQRGLFSVAFAPDYRRSGRFYVQYVDRHGSERVDELRRGRRGVRRVLALGHAATQHHGGQLQFGPDGLLYVSTGMNHDPATSQDPGSTGGKILRLDPRVPGARPEVYALGLRNPWRFSFDRARGTMLIGDVGELHSEEVDVIAAGAPARTNFGWPGYEGFTRTAAPDVPGAVAPALTFPHTRGRCAVTGGYVIRDRHLARLRGRYLYGDLCTGAMWTASLAGGKLGTPRRLGRLRVSTLVSFGQDAAGRLYAAGLDGDVYRLAG